MSLRFKSLRIAATLACLAGSLASPAATAQSASGTAQRLNVGRTGIQCVRLPCPHRGIFLPGAANMQGLRRSLLFADLDSKTPLPTMKGTPEDRARLQAAWDSRQCLEILGSLEGSGGAEVVLTIVRVVGPCR